MGAEYSHLDSISYPEAASLIKKHKGSKNSYSFSKAQKKTFANIPYARYVPLSERASSQYASSLYSSKPVGSAKPPHHTRAGLADSLHRSKTSMPAPGRADAPAAATNSVETAFVRGLSMRKSRKNRTKSAASFEPRSDKELALSKIYIKPSDFVVERPKLKSSKKDRSANSSINTGVPAPEVAQKRRKNAPTFPIRRKVQPSTMYVEPRKQRKPTHTVYDFVRPVPQFQRSASIRQSSRPGSRASVRGASRASMRRPGTGASTKTTSTLKSRAHTPSRHLKLPAPSRANTDSSFASTSTVTSQHKPNYADLFRARSGKRADVMARSAASSRANSRSRSKIASDVLSGGELTVPVKSPYGIFDVASVKSRPSTSSTLHRPTAASANKSVHAKLTASESKKQKQKNKSDATRRKHFKNHVFPVGHVATVKQSKASAATNQVRGGDVTAVGVKQPRIRVKWYNILQRTHYEKTQKRREEQEERMRTVQVARSRKQDQSEPNKPRSKKPTTSKNTSSVKNMETVSSTVPV